MLAKASSFLSSFFQGGGTPSLVLSLDAGNVLSYSGTGITWSDLTIFNNDTFFPSNNPTYSVSGGGSFQFSDSDDFFILSASANGFPLGDSQYTMEAWINPDNLTQSTSIVLYGSLGTNTANVMGILNNNIAIDWGNNVLSSPTQSMIPGNWYYLASTYDGTDRKIYLNGSLIASDTPGVTNSVESGDYFTIGYFMVQSFIGKISIVRLHTRALSGSRLLSNFNSLKTRFGYTFGSMTFDGTQSSYLISSSPDYAFGTNDFTVEAFFKSSDYSLNGGIVSLRDVSTYINGVGITLTHTATPSVTPLIEFSSGNNFLTYTASIDVWYHVAISRVGSTSSFFINGNLFNEVEDTLNYGNNDLVVGRYYTDVNDYYFNGIISNVRVINGTGLYTSNFTIPGVQLGVTASTKFLITSQQTNPTADVSGLLQSVTASNIGWTSSLPQFIVREGLEFFVDATDIVSNNSYSTSTWIDISGNGRNLTFSGPTFYPFCSPACAFSLTFQSNQTAQTSPVTISYPNGFTIESVVRFTNTSNGDGIFEFDEPSSAKYINVQRESNGQIRFEVNIGSQLLSTSTTTNNLWYHITCVYNSSTQLAKIYINGVEDASGTYVSTTSTTAPIILGLHDTYLDGSISLTRFYSIPFTPSQVLINYNYTKSVYGI